MNPASVGGGRSQLPRSLRNLFTAVQVGKPSSAEVRDIAADLFGDCLHYNLLDGQHVERLLDFHEAVITAAERRDFGRGAPAEFNLRDLIKVRPGWGAWPVAGLCASSLRPTCFSGLAVSLGGAAGVS